VDEQHNALQAIDTALGQRGFKRDWSQTAHDPHALTLAQALIERSAPSPPQTCHRVCGTFKRLFGLIIDRILKAVAENPKTDSEIVTLAGRFLHRELRVSGLERWPELYDLIGSR
jgi:hypothetical protein